MVWRAVLCDVDGVLLDSMPPALAIVRAIKKSRGEQFTQKDEIELRKIAGFNLREYFKYLFPGEPPEEAFVQWEPFQKKIVPGAISAFPYATETVAKLQTAGLLVVLATNRQAVNFSEHAGTSCPWLDQANAIQTLGRRQPRLHHTHLTTPKAKPDPEALLPILEWLNGRGIKNEEMIFVGDSLADLLAAHGNGIAFVGVLTGTVDTRKHWIQWAKEHNIVLNISNIIPTLRELPEWLKNH